MWVPFIWVLFFNFLLFHTKSYDIPRKRINPAKSWTWLSNWTTAFFHYGATRQGASEMSEDLICRVKLSLEILSRSQIMAVLCHKQSGPSVINWSSFYWLELYANMKMSLMLFFFHLLHHLGDWAQFTGREIFSLKPIHVTPWIALSPYMTLSMSLCYMLEVFLICFVEGGGYLGQVPLWYITNYILIMYWKEGE